GQDGRGQGGGHCRDRSGHAALRRYGLPPQHGGQARAAWQIDRGASRRRNPRRYERNHAAHRGAAPFRIGAALMDPTSRAFKANAHRALGDANLQRAMTMMRTGFPEKRALAIARLPEFDALRDEGIAVKNHVIAHLDFYLERFEQNVVANGGKVHWCRNADEAREVVLGLCRALDAKTVTKGKSMIGEEIAINDFLEQNGITPVETDLGEYIVQIRHEPPSQIIAPAVHLVKEQVAESFRATHTDLPRDR